MDHSWISVRDPDYSDHLQRTSESDTHDVKVQRIYQLHRQLPLYREACSHILREMQQGLARVNSSFHSSNSIAYMLAETHKRFNIWGCKELRGRGLVYLLVEREAIFDDMKRLYIAWREFNAGQPDGSSQFGHDSLSLSDIDRGQILGHLNSLLEMAGQSPDIRLLLRDLHGKSAESFIELLEEVLNDGTSEGDKFHTRCDRALRSVCKSSGLLPKSLSISTSLKTTSAHPVFGGSFGDVWKGDLDGQEVAIKAIRVFTSDHKQSEKIQKSFVQEALLLRNLNHPNILPFFGVNTTLFRWCLVSPWMPEGNIMDFMKRRPDQNRMALLVGITRGLHYLHSRNPMVVHGDLKGGNILMDDTGEPRLCDFGLSRVAMDSSIMAGTSTGAGMGSLRWMAPELIQPPAVQSGSKALTSNAKTDVYALGCVFLEIMTGKPPFSKHRTDPSIMFDILKGLRPRRPRRAIHNGLTDRLWALIEKCWASNPKQRPTVFLCLTELDRCATDFTQYLIVGECSSKATNTSEESGASSNTESSIASKIGREDLLDETHSIYHPVSGPFAPEVSSASRSSSPWGNTKRVRSKSPENDINPPLHDPSAVDIPLSLGYSPHLPPIRYAGPTKASTTSAMFETHLTTRSSSPSTAPPGKAKPLHVHTCDTCRRFRRKCDGQRPVCHRCSLRNRACTYTPYGNNPTRNFSETWGEENSEGRQTDVYMIPNRIGLKEYSGSTSSLASMASASRSDSSASVASGPPDSDGYSSTPLTEHEGNLASSRPHYNVPVVKRRRMRADPDQLIILNEAYNRTPFPTTEDRRELAEKLDMADRWVQIWFQNKRQSARRARSIQGSP